MPDPKLVYVIGPSGAGKDSLLRWVSTGMPSDAGIAFARRTITRPARPDDEDHESLDEAAFARLRRAGAFALDWQANGLSYGIRSSELSTPRAVGVVVVNGSRAHVPVAAARYPALVAVHVTARLDTLKRRLALRGRETPEQIELRVSRSVSLQWPAGIRVVEIANDGDLAEAGGALRQLLLQEAHAAPAIPQRATSSRSAG